MWLFWLILGFILGFGAAAAWFVYALRGISDFEEKWVANDAMIADASWGETELPEEYTR